MTNWKNWTSKCIKKHLLPYVDDDDDDDDIWEGKKTLKIKGLREVFSTIDEADNKYINYGKW